MAFDPITYSSLTALAEPVGSMRLVPKQFVSDKYIDTGKSFSATQYPLLAEIYGATVDPTVVSVVDLPASMTQYKGITTSNYTLVDEPPSVNPPVFLDDGLTGVAIEAGIFAAPGAVPRYTNFIGSASVYPYRYNILSDSVNMLITTDGGSTWSHTSVNFGMICRVHTNVQVVNNKFFVFGFITVSSGSDTILTAISEDGSNWTVTVCSIVTTIANPQATVSPTGAIYIFDNGNYTTDTVLLSTDLGQTFSTPGLGLDTIIHSGKNSLFVWSGGYSLTVSASTNNTLLAANFQKITPTSNLKSLFPVLYTKNLNLNQTMGGNILGGVAEKSDSIFVYTRNTSIGYLSYDSGYSWKKVNLPSILPAWSSISVIGNVYVIQTELNNLYISRDGESWMYAKVPSFESDPEVLPWKLPSYANSNSAFYGGGTATYLTAKMLKISNTTNVVPFVESSTVGAKWVVKAKK